MICKVCKRRFTASKDNKYLAQRPLSITEVMTNTPAIYEAFDCPRCGCQNIVNVREPEVNYEVIPASN